MLLIWTEICITINIKDIEMSVYDSSLEVPVDHSHYLFLVCFHANEDIENNLKKKSLFSIITSNSFVQLSILGLVP